METTLMSLPVDVDSSRMMALTKAVFPVPGDPEINMLDELLSSSMDVASIKVARKLRIEARSVERPAIVVLALLQVDRRRARARAWRGRREVGGVGGGVEMASVEISAAGVVGDRDATDAFRRGTKAEDQNTKKKKIMQPTDLVVNV
jgi:hypothetical protein